MSICKKSLLISILILLFSFNMCFAIDENQFSQTPQSQDNYANNIDTANNITSNEYNQNTSEDEIVENSEIPEPSQSVQATESQPSTTVSSVTSSTNNSTISNILSIVLIVVGVLLILLAIAILIRLHQ